MLISAYIIWLGMDFGIDLLLNIPFLSKISIWVKDYSWIVTATKIGFYLSTFFLFISFYKYLFLALASPLFAYISERTAEIITGESLSFNLLQFSKDVVRGIILSGRNFLKQLFLTLILFIFSFIPIIGLLFSFLILIIDCYYFGFSVLDYNAEREKLTAKQSRLLISNRKGLAIGNGLMMYFSILVPFIGIIIIAPLSAIAGTLTFYKHLKK
jgi:CysZ protein